MDGHSGVREPSRGRNRRGEDTRDAIRSGLATLLAGKCYADIRLAEIFRAAGVSRGAFYGHYTSKEAVASDLIEIEHERAYDIITSRIHSTPDSVEQLAVTLLTYASYMVERPQFSAALNLKRYLHSTGAAQISDSPRWHELITGLISRAIDSGDIRADVDPSRFAHFIVASIAAVRLVCAQTHSYADLRDRVKDVLQYALLGTLVPDRLDYFETYLSRHLPTTE